MNVKDDEFKKLLIKKLDELGTKIDALIQVVAITSRKEGMLKGKTKANQIELLSGLGLPRTVIAWIVGTTPPSVSVTLSTIKKKKGKRTKPTKLKQEEKVEK